MYPFFEFQGFFIYTFGLTLTLCFFLFLWILKRTSSKFGINFSFFTNRILIFFLSTFIFSRLFYTLSRWNDFVYIENFREFFITSDYNFSIMGAIFGFMIVLLTSTRYYKIRSGKYVDAVVLSFLVVSVLGYIGAFFGWQVYGVESNFGFIYTHPFSPVTSPEPIFPLALIYSAIFLLLFLILSSLTPFIKLRGIVGYVGLIAFWSIILIGDNWSGKQDYFLQTFGINFTQITAILLIVICFFRLFLIYKYTTNQEKDLII